MIVSKSTLAKRPEIVEPLLAWYDVHRRDLPWRALPEQAADPYRVWVSEIMLQQTVAATVKPYYEKFIALWPDVHALASAPLGDVLSAWAGLGYYARARNLHACAIRVSRNHGGVFPGTQAELLTLPGVGAYTAGAIASIAFGQPVAAVDGNVERVVSRLYGIETPLPASRGQIREYADQLVPQDRPGDFAQAMMDLGATICTPTSPRCLFCPLSAHCVAYRSGEPARLPRKVAKPARPQRFGRVYWIVNSHGQVLVRSRPAKGLLGGMTEFPSSAWSGVEDREAPPFPARWQALPGTVSHTFTHFHLELDLVFTHMGDRDKPMEGEWVHARDFEHLALPGLMRKVARHALLHTPQLPVNTSSSDSL